MGKRPELADLRDSGQIEQDADIVMMVHRPALAGLTHDEKSGYPTKDLGVLFVAKNRNGPIGDVYFGHNESLTRIGDYTPDMNWMEQDLKRIEREKKVDAKKLRQKYQ
jgi:replicative DNA helicase